MAIKKFVCNYCGKRFSSVRGRESHKGQVHIKLDCTNISVSLPKLIIEKLKSISEASCVTVSQLVLNALAEYLD